MTAPQRTFSLRGPAVNALSNEPNEPELWLSREPGQAPTPTRELSQDLLLGYPVVVNHDVEYTAIKIIREPSSSGAAVASFNFLASGVEDRAHEDTMLARSCALLDKFGRILDAYLSRHPEKARLAQERLVLPNAASRIFVDPDMVEEAFNAQYSARTLYLVQCLLELGKEAVRWQEKAVKQVDGEDTALLPTSPTETVRIATSRHLQDKLLITEPSVLRLGQSSVVANADFYVVCGEQVIATMESKPGCNPREIGVLVRDRLDPFDLAQDGGVKAKDWNSTLLLQLASQAVATGLSMGCLIADWGRVLLPYEVVREPCPDNGRGTSAGVRKARVIFSSSPSFYDVLGGHTELIAAKREVSSGLQNSNSKSFQFTSLPNAVFYILAWVLRAVEAARDKEEGLVREAARAGDESSKPPEDRGAGPSSKRGPPDSDPSDRDAQKPRGADRSASGPVAPRAGQKGHSGGGDKSKKGKGKETRHHDEYEALVQQFRLLTTYTSSYTPIDEGTFATVHLCLVKKALLDSAVGGDHQSDHLGGKSSFKVLPYASLDEVDALLKVQRVPLEQQHRGGKIDWRLEEPDGPPMSEEDRINIQRRTMRELSVFLRCQDVQGLFIPKLYGVVSPRNCPFSTAHKLMIQCIDGGPVSKTPRKMYLLWREELVTSAVRALGMLHSRAVWHGDISNNNILVEWRKHGAHALESSTYERVEPEQVLEAVQEAQGNMGISEEDFKPQVDKFRAADADAGENSAIVLTPTSSPLQSLKATIRPHIWLIDFADSQSVDAEAEDGREMISSELETMKRFFARMDTRYQ